jgi:hypothetical protein
MYMTPDVLHAQAWGKLSTLSMQMNFNQREKVGQD